eukprot:6518426-Alexandrium_andersonii.AAC.1
MPYPAGPRAARRSQAKPGDAKVIRLILRCPPLALGALSSTRTWPPDRRRAAGASFERLWPDAAQHARASDRARAGVL